MRLFTRYRLTVALLLVALTLVVFLNDLGDFNTDIKPEVYIAPADMIGRYVSAWTGSPYLGSPNFNVGLVPVLLLLSVLRLFLSPEFAFKAFHLMLWIAAAWGTSKLVREIAPRAGKWGALAAGVIYLANPYTIQAGATLAIALPLALLPWQLFCLVKALRSPKGWVWPAGFGLAFFGMSGMNVAVVPVLQLFAVIPVALAIKAERGLSWGDVIKPIAKCAAFVIGVSIYWLVPSMAAQATGSQIVDASESLTGIAKVSSFPEVLRGVGLWPLYGYDDKGPWVPQHAVYVASPFVMILTMAWPVLGLMALRWCTGVVRSLVAGSVAIAAVVMVGLFPSADAPASPFGKVLGAFLGAPGAAAFRTTNKIGAVLALGLAIALGVGAARYLPRVWRQPGAAPVVAALVVVLVGAWSLPAVTGRLYTSKMNIPQYWKDAAKAADNGDPASTVLLLPGQVRPDYRWTVERPDDLPNSVLRRDAVIPETTPNASAPGANFLAALNASVESGTAPHETVSTFARYLGSDKVLLRHDMVWETDGGARPAITSGLLSADSGLFGSGNFGRLGQNNVAPGTDPVASGEALLPPVQLYSVRDPRAAVRAESLAGSVIVSGDGFAFPAMTDAGLLESTPTVRYAQDLTAAQLARSLKSTGRLVITDTNARRNVIPNRLTAGHGPLLSEGEKLGATRTLGDKTADQTVLLRSGALVTASTTGGTFFDLPYGVPEFAVDGDPTTGWRFGDFRRAPGQTLSVRMPAPTELGKVPVSQLEIGRVKIDKVTLTAGGRSKTVRLPDKGSVDIDMGGVTTDRVTLKIDSIRGDGFNLVGLAELGLPGPKATRAARTPTTLSDQYRVLSALDRAQFSKTPLDILLTRVENTVDRSDDSETSLRRIVTVPDTRDFKVEADVRVNGPLEQAYDDVAGYPRDTKVRSSGIYFDSPNVRASQAADGDDDTAWVPGGQTPRGQWWEATGAQRSISAVTINQAEGFGDGPKQMATRVAISVDGQQQTVATLKLGKNTVTLPQAVQGRTVRMTIVGLSGDLSGAPPRFLEIGAGVRMQPTTPGPLDEAGTTAGRCQIVATVDGKPIRMRPATAKLGGAGDNGTPWVGCEEATLETGERRIEQAPGFTVDSLSFKDAQRPEPAGAATPPTTKILKNGSSSKTLQVNGAGGYAVVIGQSIDPRWKATMDGKNLGAPVVLDGFSAGWIIPEGGRHKIEIRYAPQRNSNIALAISAIVVVLSAALVLISWARKRGKKDDDDGDEPEGEGMPDTVPAQGASRSSTRLSSRADVRQRARHADVRASGGPRVLREIGLIALAGFAVGWAGLLAGVLLVGVMRLRPVRPSWLVAAGAGLVMASILVYIAFLGDLRGEVSADAVSKTLLPHYLAGAGLVIALAGSLLARDHHHEDPDEDMQDPVTMEAPAQ